VSWLKFVCCCSKRRSRNTACVSWWLWLSCTQWRTDSNSGLVWFGCGVRQDLVNSCKRAGTKLDEWFVAVLTIHLIDVVHQVHSCRIIHADFKPDNILVTQLWVTSSSCTTRRSSTKRRHQSQEWTILTHDSCFIQREVTGFQDLLDSLHPRSTRVSQWSPPVLQRRSC